MRKLFPSIIQVMPLKQRGKGVYFNVPHTMDEEESETFIIKKYEDAVKLNQLHLTAEYQFPTRANRLNERLPKGQVRRIIYKEKLRKRDRAIINGFCNYFMWLHFLHKPNAKKN